MHVHFTKDETYDLQVAAEFGHSEAQMTLLADCYHTSSPYLEQSIAAYQQSWDEIDADFSSYIAQETGHAWFYDEYTCVVSFVHRGISNWGNAPKIVRGWDENPYTMRRITAHELILSHYFEIYKRHYAHEALTEGQVWALAEIAAFALTSLTDRVKNFWPWNTEYYTTHNHPQIVELQESLKHSFLEKISFDEYIKEGIRSVKKYPQIAP